MSNRVTVDGHHYKIRGAQTEALRHTLDGVVLKPVIPDTAGECREQRDGFLRALPAWALRDLIEGCSELLRRAEEIRRERGIR